MLNNPISIFLEYLYSIEGESIEEEIDYDAIALAIKICDEPIANVCKDKDMTMSSDFKLGSLVFPPNGFVNLWNRAPDWFKKMQPKEKGIIRSHSFNKDFAVLKEVQVEVNKELTFVPDRRAYGKLDWWALPKKYHEFGVSTADCEDYCIEKKRRLVERGYSPNCLSIALCYTRHGQAHAVLAAHMTMGVYILDNRLHRYAVLPWDVMPYKWLALQIPGQFMWRRILT